MLRHSGSAFKIAWLGGEQVHGGPYNHRSLENWATEDLKTVGGPSLRQARLHECLCKIHTGPSSALGFWAWANCVPHPPWKGRDYAFPHA